MDITLWSQEELKLLKEVFEPYSYKELCATFPDKQYSSILYQAHKLGLTRSRLFSEEELEIIKKYYSNTPKEELLKLLPRMAWDTIRGKALSLGLYREFDAKKWTDEEIANLKELYPVASKKEVLAKITRHGWPTIICKAYRLNIERKCRISRTEKRITLDFSSIDSEHKAYILGLISADGSITKDERTVDISLQEQDGYILEWMRDVLYPDGEVKKEIRDGKGTAMRLRIHSRELAKQFMVLNVVPKKSLTLELPPEGSIPNDMMPHYIRGLFDGDGDISFDKRSELSTGVRFRISGSCKHMTGLADWLEHHNIVKKGSCHVYPALNICSLNIISSSALKMFEYIYKDATVYLTRKRDRYEEIKSKPAGTELDFWSDEEKERLIKLWKDPSLKNIAQVAEALGGRTACSVRTMAGRRLKLPDRRTFRKSKQQPL